MAQKALIIGAGLAGTCMAHQLLSNGLEVVLMDTGTNHSSAIAAGMVNPMVFRRMNKSWRLDEFLPEAKAFYLQIEQRLASSFFHPIVIRRFFSSEQERILWEEKSQDQEFFNYLEKITSQDLQNTDATNTFGSGRVKNAFWINAPMWVAQNSAYFKAKHQFITSEFDPQKWQPQTRIYEGQRYDYVVFCLGYRQKEEATFSYLPLQQTKGQTLLIESKQINATESLNRKCFVLPLGADRFKVGATYEWNNSTLNCTPEARIQLEQNLAALGSYNYQIQGQNVGVRPTVLDRRPLLGEHPQWRGVYILNGLGTKGYMMAPTLARELTEYILDNKPLHPETAISRFTD